MSYNFKQIWVIAVIYFNVKQSFQSTTIIKKKIKSANYVMLNFEDISKTHFSVFTKEFCG